MKIKSINDINRSKLARSTGYTLSHISRVFSKKRNPSIRCLKKISVVLGISTDDLIQLIEKGEVVDSE